MTPPRLACLAATLAACAAPHKTVANHPPLVVHTDPKLVDMVIEPTTSLVLANATTELGLRIQITGHEAPDARRPPLDLALVLDTSGSMEGDAIDAVRASAHQLVEKLQDGDHISLVEFNSSAEVVVPSTTIDPGSRKHVLDAIDHIRARGTTDLASGLALGFQQLNTGRFAQGINRIVLLSDGVPNTSTPLPNLIAQIRTSGASITTLGIGIDYDTNLMTQLARDTGGSFHYIDKPDEVAAVFDSELTKMTRVIGRNLTLVLAPGPGVQMLPMPGLALDGTGKLYATIGDLAAGETRDLMIPIKVAARSEGATVELADALLTFDDVVARSGQQHRDGYASLKTSKDTAALKSAIKIDLEVARIRASAAAAILDAMQLARTGQLDPAKARIAQALAGIKAAAARLKDADLDKLAKELETVGKQLAQMTQQIAQPVPKVSVEMDRPAKAPVTEPAPATAPPAIERELRAHEAAAQETVQGIR